MKVTTEERIYLGVYLGLATILIIISNDIVYTLMGAIIALFGFVMVIFTRMKQITRILKKNNLWIEEQLQKDLKTKDDKSEKID